MDKPFTSWLTEELDQRGWSHRELARQTGLSQAFVSQVISGSRKVSANFCAKVADALDIDPTHVFKLAGILPDEPTPTAPGPVTAEILKVVEGLTSEQRHQVLDFARYIAQQGRNSNS